MAVTAEQAKTWCGLSSDVMSEDDEALFAIVLAAVTAHITDKYEEPAEGVADLATLMQTARWWMRKDTPGGVIAFDDLGAVRVSRLDPDVSAMLDLKVVFA